MAPDPINANKERACELIVHNPCVASMLYWNDENRYVFTRITQSIFISGLILCFLSNSANAICLQYEPKTVEISGTISAFESYGPPGYGDSPEVDTKEHYEALVLNTPLCLTASSDQEAEQNVDKIQLVFSNPPYTSAMVGKHARIVGQLFHQVTGHHHTKVLITVERIMP